MRSKTNLPIFLVAFLFGSTVLAGPLGNWTARGVVVQKSFKPTPLSHSLGLEGIYKFEVRDEKNRVRRQMVTAAVYQAYEIGDDFDPSGTPPTVEERTARLAAAEAKLQPVLEDIPAEAPSEPAPRLAANFPQEMLPETEGF